MTTTRAVVFDFDGTIVDTETPVFESWAETFRLAGTEPIALDVWLQSIGKADDEALDVRAVLCDRLGIDELPTELDDQRRTIRNEMLYSLPVRSGVREWIDEAQRRGLALAIASSSPTDWVVPHLERLDLRDAFPVVSCADPGVPGKPDPRVYLSACSSLGVRPAHAVAIEDSATGATAAIAAGLRCVAVPGPITTSMNFDHATVRADSLIDLNPSDWM